MITVYKSGNSFRVMTGNIPNLKLLKDHIPFVYNSAHEAYVSQTDANIRSAILRLDPTAHLSDAVFTPTHKAVWAVYWLVSGVKYYHSIGGTGTRVPGEVEYFATRREARETVKHYRAYNLQAKIERI